MKRRPPKTSPFYKVATEAVMPSLLALQFADPMTRTKLPLTRLDRQRKHQRNHKERRFTLDLAADGYADMVYLMQTWGFPSRRRTALVALKFLANATRNGLERIDLTTD